MRCVRCGRHPGHEPLSAQQAYRSQNKRLPSPGTALVSLLGHCKRTASPSRRPSPAPDKGRRQWISDPTGEDSRKFYTGATIRRQAFGKAHCLQRWDCHRHCQSCERTRTTSYMHKHIFTNTQHRTDQRLLYHRTRRSCVTRVSKLYAGDLVLEAFIARRRCSPPK